MCVMGALTAARNKLLLMADLTEVQTIILLTVTNVMYELGLPFYFEIESGKIKYIELARSLKCTLLNC